MIRINLLAGARKPPKRTFEFAHKMPVLCGFVILATALFIAWSSWSIRQERERLDQDIQRAQQEAQTLRTVLQQVQEFEQRKAQLQQRVSLIEELRRDQSGPVHLLDEVSRALPDRLWLSDMRQDGDAVRLEGQTTSLTSLSDFVGNLEASGYFARPVEILDSAVQTAPTGVDLVKFSVRAQFVMPRAEPAAGKTGT
jgi:type IV pilus assembly protein PilN